MHAAGKQLLYCSKQLKGMAGGENHKTKPAVFSLAKHIM